MKKLVLFFVLVVIATVLTHLIIDWFDPDSEHSTVKWIPAAILFVLFYVFGNNQPEEG